MSLAFRSMQTIMEIATDDQAILTLSSGVTRGVGAQGKVHKFVH